MPLPSERVYYVVQTPKYITRRNGNMEKCMRKVTAHRHGWSRYRMRRNVGGEGTA
jgi:hypothetical protein